MTQVFLIIFTWNKKRYYVLKNSTLPTDSNIEDVNKFFGIDEENYILLGNKNCIPKDTSTVCFYLYEETLSKYDFQELTKVLNGSYKLVNIEDNKNVDLLTSSALYWYREYKNFDIDFIYSMWKEKLSTRSAEYLKKLLDKSPEKYIELLYLLDLILNLPSDTPTSNLSFKLKKLLSYR